MSHLCRSKKRLRVRRSNSFWVAGGHFAGVIKDSHFMPTKNAQCLKGRRCVKAQSQLQPDHLLWKAIDSWGVSTQWGKCWPNTQEAMGSIPSTGSLRHGGARLHLHCLEGKSQMTRSSRSCSAKFGFMTSSENVRLYQLLKGEEEKSHWHFPISDLSKPTILVLSVVPQEERARPV